MKGIYCFTNIKNNKKYIGQSMHLENRRKSHLRNFNNPNLDSYNTAFYLALRKYGIENFSYSILFSTNDFVSRQDLNQLEIYYISKYNSYKNGYNMNRDGEFTSGDKSLSEEDVLKIYYKIKDTEITFFDIAKEFKISDSLVSMINQGKVWSYLGNKYPIRENTRLANVGGRNPNSTFSDDGVMIIRNLFVSKTLSEIKKIYEGTPFSTLKKIVYGVSYQHLPVYKKREAKWFLKGTCIDYPRLEE